MSTQTIKNLSLSLMAMLLTFSCSRSSDNEGVKSESTVLTTVTHKNIHAPQSGGQGQPVSGEFTKFSFSANAVVTNDQWDVAFRGTSIVINGGTAIGLANEPTRTGNASVSMVSSTLDALKAIPAASTFKQDAANTYAIPTGSGNGWYNYNPTNHMISPVPGKIFVVKTHDGKYVKFAIISFYKDAPASPDPLTTASNYYSLRFVMTSQSSGF